MEIVYSPEIPAASTELHDTTFSEEIILLTTEFFWIIYLQNRTRCNLEETRWSQV